LPRSDLVIGQSSSSISSRGVLRAWFASVVALFLLSCTLCASPAREKCVPIRWTGGPLELEWRGHAKTLPTDPSVRDALARWYEPGTLNVLADSPVNCLLVTWSAPSDAALEAEQQRLVKAYTEAAHNRGLAVLGLVYAAGDASKIAADVAKASLDGLVLDGDSLRSFPSACVKPTALCRSLRSRKTLARGDGNLHQLSPSRAWLRADAISRKWASAAHSRASHGSSRTSRWCGRSLFRHTRARSGSVAKSKAHQPSITHEQLPMLPQLAVVGLSRSMTLFAPNCVSGMPRLLKSGVVS